MAPCLAAMPGSMLIVIIGRPARAAVALMRGYAASLLAAASQLRPSVASGGGWQMASRDGLILGADPAQDWQDAVRGGLVTRSRQPLNCETPPPLLGGDVTPTSRFFRRNHFPIPDLDAETWRLEGDRK